MSQWNVSEGLTWLFRSNSSVNSLLYFKIWFEHDDVDVLFDEEEFEEELSGNFRLTVVGRETPSLRGTW